MTTIVDSEWGPVYISRGTNSTSTCRCGRQCEDVGPKTWFATCRSTAVSTVVGLLRDKHPKPKQRSGTASFIR